VTGDLEGKKSSCYSKLNWKGILPPWIPYGSLITKSSLRKMWFPNSKRKEKECLDDSDKTGCNKKKDTCHVLLFSDKCVCPICPSCITQQHNEGAMHEAQYRIQCLTANRWIQFVEEGNRGIGQHNIHFNIIVIQSQHNQSTWSNEIWSQRLYIEAPSTLYCVYFRF
jgi:hypothetical protein